MRTVKISVLKMHFLYQRKNQDVAFIHTILLIYMRFEKICKRVFHVQVSIEQCQYIVQIFARKFRSFEVLNIRYVTVKRFNSGIGGGNMN